MLQPIAFKFGDWKPDVPPLANVAFPAQTEAYFNGGTVPLVTAENCYYRATGYRPYLPLSPISNALGSACIGAIGVYDTNGALQIFAGTANDLYKLSGTSWTKVSRITPAWAASTSYTLGTLIVDSNGNLQKCTTAGTSGSPSHPTWNQSVSGTTTDNTVTWTLLNLGAYQTSTNLSFQQFGNCLDVTNGIDVMQTIDVTAGTNFAALDTNASDLVPVPQVLGVIRDFLFAGNTNDSTNGVVPYRVQWSALDLDGSWPVPNTQNAFAFQAGAQTLYSEYGPVQAIGDNETFGIIFQATGIVRVEYVGGNVVFNFYTYEKKRGAVGPNAVVRCGDKYYFLASDGFCVTDGSSVQNIGYGKVNDWFFANAKASTLSTVSGCLDTINKLIIWAYESASGSALDSLIIYNYEEGFFTTCSQNCERLFSVLSGEAWISAGVDSSHKYGQFTGTAATTTITTQDFQINQGGRAFVNGVRPLLDGTASAAVGTRTNLSSSSTLGSYVAQETRSNISPQRADSMYHRISIQTSGSYTDAIGFTCFQKPSGQY